jgi:hypothetical protein
MSNMCLSNFRRIAGPLRPCQNAAAAAPPLRLVGARSAPRERTKPTKNPTHRRKTRPNTRAAAVLVFGRTKHAHHLFGESREFTRTVTLYVADLSLDLRSCPVSTASRSRLAGLARSHGGARSTHAYSVRPTHRRRHPHELAPLLAARGLHIHTHSDHPRWVRRVPASGRAAIEGRDGMSTVLLV